MVLLVAQGESVIHKSVSQSDVRIIRQIHGQSDPDSRKMKIEQRIRKTIKRRERSEKKR